MRPDVESVQRVQASEPELPRGVAPAAGGGAPSMSSGGAGSRRLAAGSSSADKQQQQHHHQHHLHQQQQHHHFNQQQLRRSSASQFDQASQLISQYTRQQLNKSQAQLAATHLSAEGARAQAALEEARLEQQQQSAITLALPQQQQQIRVAPATMASVANNPGAAASQPHYYATSGGPVAGANDYSAWPQHQAPAAGAHAQQPQAAPGPAANPGPSSAAGGQQHNGAKLNSRQNSMGAPGQQQARPAAGAPFIKDEIDVVFNRLMALEAFRKLHPSVIRNLCSYAFVERIDKGVIGE